MMSSSSSNTTHLTKSWVQTKVLKLDVLCAMRQFFKSALFEMLSRAVV
jgi:hypothetical protein